MKSLQKTLLKTLLVFFTIPLLISCSKDDDVEPKELNKEFKVTIEHTGDIQHYLGYITVNGAIDNAQNRVPVSGLDFDDETTVGEVTIYEKSFNPLTRSFTIKTDKKAALMQFGYSAWYNGDTGIQHTPVQVTIKYYVNDMLVNTEVFGASETIDGSTHLGKLDASNY